MEPNPATGRQRAGTSVPAAGARAEALPRQGLQVSTLRVSSLWASGFWVDTLIIWALCALVAGVVALAGRWSAPLQPTLAIDLSPWALPQ